jgi:hypothetical protein
MPTVLTICGSLRKGSFNAMTQRALPSLAPEGMVLKPRRLRSSRSTMPTSRTRPASRRR